MKRFNLVLLHGALGAASQWRALAAELEERFTIYTPEFEGHGATPAPDRPFQIERFGQTLAEYIEHNELAPAHIFGYSMGGYVALHLALKRSELVGRIMTLATKFAWTPEAAHREMKMLDPDIIEQKVPAFVSALEKRHPALGWRTVLARTAAMMRALGDVPALRDDDLAAIRQPVCVGIGEWDTMVTVEESEHASHLLPNGTLRMFPEMRHPLENVDVIVLAKAITEFFSS